ncbi:MAG: glycosyltransferase [Kiritimatiellae bacterium]|nr:glycosyltransferase [Kiritimatiellia bacterium]
MKTVSAIIPVYNGELYVKRAVESALAQTLRDIEVICVDDGSTDGTAAILDALASSDPRVKVLHRPNEGVSAARNAGMDAAQGRYIAFIDADDELEPEMYERLVAKAEAGNCDVVQCGHCEVKEGAISRTSMPGSKCTGPDIRAIPEIVAVQTKYIWDKLFRASMLDGNSIRFAPFGYHEDHLFLFDVDLVAKNFASIPYIGYRYSKSSEGAATRSYDARLLDCPKAYRIICRKAREAGLFTLLAPHIWRNCSLSYVLRVKAFANYSDAGLQEKIVEGWKEFFDANFPRWQKNLHLAGYPVVVPKDGKLKVLLMGGTGALGAHLRDILAAEGHHVFVTSRSAHDDSGNIVYLQGNALEPAFFRKLMASKWDVVVDFMIHGPDGFGQSLDMLLASAGQYVFLSSSRVYADAGMKPITETSPRIVDTATDPEYLATNEYALSKGRSEDILASHPKKNWTIIRPYVTFSEQRLQLGPLEKENWLARALAGKPIVFSEDIACRTTTLTYGRDVARGMAAVIGRSEALGETYHITGLRSILWRDVLDLYVRVIAEETGKRPEVVMTRESCQLDVPGLLKYQVVYDRRYDRVFDDSKIGRFIDVSTFRDPLEALESCLRKFLSAPSFLKINPELDALHDKACGIEPSAAAAGTPRYTAERNVQILIAALKAHGIRTVIASPGTTNLTFVASLQYDGSFEVYSAPDERSAAYMACGLAAERGKPVVITCTGATASRNYLPGLTEAYYRKLPVLAVTGTLCERRVGQLTPQVMDRSSRQPDVVRLSVSMPLVNCKDDEWQDTVAANRAILELTRHGGGPAHINLETGYSSDYSVAVLPPVRVIRRRFPGQTLPAIPEGAKVCIFVGAHVPWSASLERSVDLFCRRYGAVVVCDHASNYRGAYGINGALACYQQSRRYERYRPDILIHIGEVSGDYPSMHICGIMAKVWRVSPDGEIRDTFRRLFEVFEMDEERFFGEYAKVPGAPASSAYRDGFSAYAADLLSRVPDLPFSNIWVASQGSRSIPGDSVVHFGILNSFRSWTLWPIPRGVAASCNTGGFGIDGCLSTVLGASLADPKRLHFAVLGDLAFFYDMNALGNRHVGRNLRILLVNNGKGVEFRIFNHPAYKFGESADRFIAADGHYGSKSRALVRHYAGDLGFEYMSASSKEEYLEVAPRFWSPAPAEKPMLLEVFTNGPSDSDALRLMTLIDGPAPAAPAAPAPSAPAERKPSPAPAKAPAKAPAPRAVKRTMNSRKIAILTFHTAFNCGAHLQAWALQIVLRRLGFDPEFPDCIGIGYYPRFCKDRRKNLSRGEAFMKELRAIGVEDVKRHRFRMFAKHCLRIVPMKKEDVDKRYGAVIVGSDQVWNSGITRTETSYFLTTMFGNPRLLRYSYAISMGDKPPAKDRLPAIAGAARRFENVSVRENLLPDLRDRYGRKPMVDPDPTLLLNAADFNRIAYPKRLVKKPYLLVYSLFYVESTWKAAREAAARMGLKLVTVQCYQYGHYRQKGGKDVVINASPDRFLAYFRDASAVITSSFHGTAFSLIYRKPFAVLPNYLGKPPLRSVTLLRQLKEDSHVVSNPADSAAIAAALANPPKPSTAEALKRLQSAVHRRLRDMLPDVSKAPAIKKPVRRSVLTWPLRKAWGGVKCIGDNGIVYTVKHAWGKVLRAAGVRSSL